MIDRTIPFYNAILLCRQYKKKAVSLPAAYQIRTFQPGDETAWAKLEYEIGDFDSFTQAYTYFVETYTTQKNFQERTFLAVEKQTQKIVGSVIAWHDARQNQTVASLHWLIVLPEYQNHGIGTALCQTALEKFQAGQEFPVWIHTQPWSYPAIFLYCKLGFRLQKTATFSHYENQYPDVMRTLQGILPETAYHFLCTQSE